jgi:hypothetical protein
MITSYGYLGNALGRLTWDAPAIVDCGKGRLSPVPTFCNSHPVYLSVERFVFVPTAFWGGEWRSSLRSREAFFVN